MTSEQIWEKINPPAGGGVFIIAEIGKNFIQSPEDRPVSEYLRNAKELVDKAVWAGADAIKFQTHTVEDEQLNIPITSPHAKGIDRYTWVTRNEKATPIDEFWKPIKAYCDEKGIIFFSTPFSRLSARKLMEIGTPLWKIGSADILDFVCMDFLRNTSIPIIMSSGMSTLEEVELGLNFLREKNQRVALMHCLSKYPGLPEEANLAVMQLYREKFPNIPIGFSENSTGTEPSMIAVALGATMIEKHLTTRRDLWGADHKTSSTPEEFKAMVDEIRTMENNPQAKEKWLHHPKFKDILGVKEKKLQSDEVILRPIWRKSLMAGRDLPVGTQIKAEDIFAMRPYSLAGGLPSEKYEEVIGKKTTKDLKKYDPITLEVLAE
ncbi:MAG: hypothetical protein G01um10143_127 [Parcubacteria group bacterium Gr01-1014_3]|nr:MAG: hypothetical protein G01um10143_127 [Parcubacteria group bacterium Gr01-1014_3]